MPDFKCTLTNSGNHKQVFFITTTSAENARAQLLKSSPNSKIKVKRYYWRILKNFYLKTIPYLPKTRNTLLTVIENRLKFGLSLDKIFLELSLSYKGYRIRNICQNLYSRILHGAPLSDCLQQYPLLFPKELCLLLKNIAQENTLSNTLEQYKIIKEVNKSVFLAIFIKLIPKIILLLLVLYGLNHLMTGEIKAGLYVAQVLNIQVPYSVLSFVTYFNVLKMIVLPTIILIILTLFLIKIISGLNLYKFKIVIDFFTSWCPPFSKLVRTKNANVFLLSIYFNIKGGFNIQKAIASSGKLINNVYLQQQIQQALMKLYLGNSLKKSFHTVRIFTSTEHALFSSLTTNNKEKTLNALIKMLHNNLNLTKVLFEQAASTALIIAIVFNLTGGFYTFLNLYMTLEY